ncbi:MAG: cytidine deaminase [Acidimicrobiia bacterium]|nr:cytidine deaminase [Acidimicrobiia bacterium]MBT8216693.1 cytidine deaminase [Acidimicrobiia bacterium]NNF10950.1 cytidine deaminase [Acidimicrobiia bacterium]NNL69372.1 cytidine deaminase [Acidimicrobiia bacterium]
MAHRPTDEVLQDLLDTAERARERAYVPYSGFDAGAAVRTAQGATVVGSLVENLVFGLAMCAERVALFQTVAAGAGRPLALALAAPPTAGEATFPCGSCLQVAAELGGMEMLIVVADPNDDGAPIQRTVAELGPGLPHRKTLLT